MIAAVLGGNEPPRLEERPAPAPAVGEALVRVLLAGVCSTDLELAKGYMGFRGVPGHEFVGEVVSAPGAAAGFSTSLAGRDPGLPNKSFPVVVEATGSPEGLGRALELVRPRGTVVLKTTCAEARPLNLAPVVIDEVTIVGSRCGPFAP